MSDLRPRMDEPIELVLKKFKRQVQQAGIISEYRRGEVYEKPSVRRKRKAAAAKKRSLKKLRLSGLR